MKARIILYVEDDDAAFELVRIILNEADPQVKLCHAHNGEQALEMLQQGGSADSSSRPDLILLDLNLPKKNGFEVLADLKADDSFRTIPVVIFSTSVLGSDRVESLERGAQAYVTKATSFDSFVDAVRMVYSHLEKSARGAS